MQKAGSGKAFVDFRKMYDEVQPIWYSSACRPPAMAGLNSKPSAGAFPFLWKSPCRWTLPWLRKSRGKSRKKQLITAAGFQCRYDDINDPAREYIRSHPIAHVCASRVGGIPGTDWWNIKSASGGQLVEQTIHQMDMLRYMLGREPETVYSVATRGLITQQDNPGYFTDDLSTTLITFEGGLTCTMMTGCYSKNGASWDSKMTFGSLDSRMDYVLCSNIALYGVDPRDSAATVAGTIAGDGTQRKSEMKWASRTNPAWTLAPCATALSSTLCSPATLPTSARRMPTRTVPRLSPLRATVPWKRACP